MASFQSVQRQEEKKHLEEIHGLPIWHSILLECQQQRTTKMSSSTSQQWQKSGAIISLDLPSQLKVGRVEEEM